MGGACTKHARSSQGATGHADSPPGRQVVAVKATPLCRLSPALLCFNSLGANRKVEALPSGLAHLYTSLEGFGKVCNEILGKPSPHSTKNGNIGFRGTIRPGADVSGSLAQEILLDSGFKQQLLDKWRNSAHLKVT